MKRFLLFFTLLLAAGSLAFGQTVQITGTVTSTEDGLAVPGVTVTVQGTTIGVLTDVSGRYSLNVPTSAETLVFSYVGMKRLEVEIANRNVINVALESDVLAMGEVVVLGYATRGKNELTGSTVQLSGDELRSVPVVTVDQTLQGKVAGVNISSSSGTPGSVQDIRIRGVGSITGDNDPLIIIDGAPVINDNLSGDTEASSSLNPLSALNSNDIESITVLKDASATAAYGARGSNGVIVITTKRGKQGKTTFDVSASTGFPE
jgi:TonB-dependent SusC/RagA subfamily outer membrane receptor